MIILGLKQQKPQENVCQNPMQMYRTNSSRWKSRSTVCTAGVISIATCHKWKRDIASENDGLLYHSLLFSILPSDNMDPLGQKAL